MDRLVNGGAVFSSPFSCHSHCSPMLGLSAAKIGGMFVVYGNSMQLISLESWLHEHFNWLCDGKIAAT